MINGIVIGGEEAVARFNDMSTRLRAELRVGIGRAALLVLVQTKENKLSGQVLKTPTGRLRRSINAKITESATGVQGTVGTNVPYAHVHEFGFQGTVSVRESLRTIKATGKQFTVRAHSRKMNMPERSFLRSALADMAEPIRQEFQDALNRAIR
jgi:HK97 gp10 family phage protein